MPEERGTVKYERYKPEQTILYQIIEKILPAVSEPHGATR
jgi:hypothetical protein